MSEDARLDALERTIERLAHELTAAQRALADLRSAARSEAPAPRGDVPVRAASDPDAALRAKLRTPPARLVPLRDVGPKGDGLENWIGRYGVLALAVLTIVMGAGALVSWAITHGLLGPWVRVALGTILAIAIAGAGWRLRRRGSRGYGNVLLALSAAVVDVVAWGAGPRLGLVPPWVSLNVADMASVALATLAILENEELLFGVGLGGALIAPFAMATGESHRGLLAAYGLIVLASAIHTLGSRAWRSSVAFIIAGTVVYTAGAAGFDGGPSWVNREFAAGFAAAIAVIALLWERVPSRPWIALAAVTTAGFAAHRANGSAAPTLDALLAAPETPLFALAGTLLFFAIARAIDEQKRSAEWMLAVAIIPPLFVHAALSPFKSYAAATPAAIVLIWGLAYAAFAFAEHGRRRGVLMMMSGFAGLWAIMLVLDGSPHAIPPVLAVYAVLLAAVSRSQNQPAVLAVTAAALMLSYGHAMVHLAERSGYTTSPFVTAESLGVASAVVAVYVSARYGLPDTVALSGEDTDRADLAALGASTVAFAWGYLELRRAFSPDISTFLLIAYLATWGVGTIHVGRARGESGLRQVGLALSVVAALYAISAASDVQLIGLRVGSYLLVGAFLLGVAWWYRAEQPAMAGRSNPEGER